MTKSPTKNAGKINVFAYSDYRSFVKDWYLVSKEHRSSFSFRNFSKKAGFKTSNFMLLVMQGKRNLTEDSLKKFSVGLSLNKQEQEFFRNLVFFNQAKTHDDKTHYYQKLLQSKKFKEVRPIEKQHYEYYSKWYHPVIRELLVSKDFDGTPEWLSRRLSPSITPAQASKSIALLESLGFIKKNGANKWQQTSSIVTTGPELTSTIVHNYHKSLLDLSKDVMDKISMQDRDTSAMTLGVKRERLPEIKSKIREFRQEILKMVAGDTEPDEVAQLHIQFFPVTKKEGQP
jgi:uncharacterized protein (TIGR02147 family)